MLIYPRLSLNLGLYFYGGRGSADATNLTAAQLG